jgi:hypothetical protein
LILALVADLLGVTGVLNEVLGKLLLLADRFLDRAYSLADLHLPLDAAFFFAFEQAHQNLALLFAHM